MFKNFVSIGDLLSNGQAAQFAVIPKKPRFSMAKTKEKLAEFFSQNEAIRKLCEENKQLFPRMHQSVQGTAWQLLMYYMTNWGKSTARNYEIRITYSYLRKALNNSCCIATLKNHINKLLGMYKGFIREKYRGGLGLEHQNTACIVLVVNPQVLQFADERHNEAVRMGELSAEQSTRIRQEKQQNQRRATQSIVNQLAFADARAAQGRAVPSPLSEIFKAALDAIPKRE